MKVAPSKVDFFSTEEIARLITAANAVPEWQTAIMLAADTGLRIGELLALEWGDIDLKARLLTVMTLERASRGWNHRWSQRHVNEIRRRLRRAAAASASATTAAV